MQHFLNIHLYCYTEFNRQELHDHVHMTSFQARYVKLIYAFLKMNSTVLIPCKHDMIDR